MSWWGGNWNPDRTTRQQAANAFLGNDGYLNTIFGGGGCRSSADCASGFACAGGRCVQRSSQQSSTGGTCGDGTGGGGCGGDQVQIIGSNGEILASGDAVGIVGGVYKSYQWEPVYAADGCTVTGCKLGECGGGLDGDCPQGERSCRYDAFGTVNCFCGPPVYTGCSTFCTSYFSSTGEEAEGCSGLACDECSYCDEIFVSASGTCRPLESGGPCHCKNDLIPDCYKCDENGSTVPDLDNCQECVTITNVDCGCGTVITNTTCCQPLGTDGLTITNKCQDLIDQDCAKACEEQVDPCKGICEVVSGDCGGTDDFGNPVGDCGSNSDDLNGLPLPPVNQPGQRNTTLGYIEVPGQTPRLIWERCDVSELPEECALCDCNCNNDCPNCQLCGADGKCYPDPACEYSYFYEIAWSIWRYRESACNYAALGCDCSVRITYYNSPDKRGINSGQIGVDPQGLSWAAYQEHTWDNSYAYGCPYPPSTGTWTELRPLWPDGTFSPGGSITIGHPQASPGYTSMSLDWHDVGVLAGYGNSLQEAQAQANALYDQLT